MSDDKPPIESVTAGENPTARDVPSSKGGKRKRPASERSASELQSVRRERQPKRKATSVTQYITAETKFVDEGQLEIDKIIGAINADEPPAIIIRELKRLKSRFVSFGDLDWSR
ncbi:hypothetical protein V490_03137 [Pseudogymnoascus sp. VKM F-3557]|nr:hypothetical protein V490_03137 [Pseudogymnoascus sp. VKM F-3557]